VYLLDGSLTADDVAGWRIYLTLGGPKPPMDPLGPLIPAPVPPEAAESPETARYVARSKAQRARRQLEQLARLTHHAPLLAALARCRASALSHP